MTENTPVDESAEQPTTRSEAPATEDIPTRAFPTQDAPAFFKPPVEKSADLGQPIPETFTSASAPKERKLAVPVIAALVIGAVVGGASGAGIAMVMSNKESTINQAAVQGVTINDSKEISDVTAVAAKASPSVVTISMSDGTNAGTGSGVIISSDGYVLTNSHVATLDGATLHPTLQVQDSSGRLYSATVVGTDPIVDLAVLKLENASGLTPIEWADSAKLNVGDATIALGAPLGLAGSVTTGIISALNRSIEVASSAVDEESTDQESGNTPFFNFDNGQGSQATTSQAYITIPVIQTDAAINPGNSGGALLDNKGRLIGINVAIASAGDSTSQTGNIGVGFALPSNLAKRVSDEIIKNGKATHGLLGAQVSDAASDEASTIVGAKIIEIVGGGAAEKGGLTAGDIVVMFNGVPVSSASDLTAQVRMAGAKTDASITYVRNGGTKTANVTLGTLTQ